ncbi:MAG: hypothetical protein SCK70_01575, partial [bacterium]|nr:hypothetical protein [bacterium]
MKRWLKIFISLFFVVGILLLGFKYKLHIKSAAQKHPMVFRMVQQIKRNSIDKLIDRLQRETLKPKPKHVTILVDVSKSIEKHEKFWGGFGHDFFYSGVTAPANRAFLKLVKHANNQRQVFTHYRSHNIFSDRDAPNGEHCGGKVYKEDAEGNPIYDWHRVNRVFDELVSAKLIPVVEFGFMPDALTSDSNRIGNWQKANVAPPKDYNKWKNLVFETVKHFEQRYGRDDILSWFFEVWNEPDLWFHFWISDPNNPKKTDLNSFLKLYDYTVAGAKAANPQIKIGGPAIAGWPDVLEDFLRHTVNGKNHVAGGIGTPIDFYSFHKYGDIDEKLRKLTKFYVDNALFVDKKKFSSTPFLITEFGPAGTRWKGNWRNTSYVSAWVCKAVDAMFDLGDEYGLAYRPQALIYWTGIGEGFNSGRGDLAIYLGGGDENILKGPAFNAYDALSYLGDERVALTGSKYGDYVNGIATRHEEEGFEVLLYHFDEGFINPDRKGDPVKTTLQVKNVPPGNYYIQHYKIDDKHSNAYEAWKAIGSPQSLSSAQIKFLKEKDGLTLAEPVYQEKISDSMWEKDVNMPVNSVSLHVVKKVTDLTPPEPPEKLVASKINTEKIFLAWSESPPATDGETADYYKIYRDG